MCIGFLETNMNTPTQSISNIHTLTDIHYRRLKRDKLLQIQNSEEPSLVNMGIAHRPHFAYFESVCYNFCNISVSELGDPRQSLQLDTRNPTS